MCSKGKRRVIHPLPVEPKLYNVAAPFNGSFPKEIYCLLRLKLHLVRIAVIRDDFDHVG